MNQIKMNIPSAAEAKHAIESGEYEKAQKQALEVESLITKAIAEGKSYAGGNGFLEPFLKAKLTEMGYEIHSHKELKILWK